MGVGGRYFDGITTLNSSTVEILTSESGIFEEEQVIEEAASSPRTLPKTYEFRKRNLDEGLYTSYSYSKTKTDPELTRVRRQKSNLNHKLILQQLEEYLESLGCDPVENDHIDLFAKIPGDGKYLFEVKSTNNDNLLSQTRKGVSQLYEYRYRYQGIIGYNVNLCLVLPKQPSEIEWLEEYLCKDREIGVIWFNERGEMKFPSQGKELVKSLIL